MAKDWSPERVKQELRQRGTSIGELGARLGYAEKTIYSVVKAPMPLAERAIAEALGLLPQDIWPSRYESDGWPRGLRKLRPLFFLKPVAGNVKSGERA